MRLIDDPADAALDDYRDLRPRDGRPGPRTGTGAVVVEGVVALRRVLHAGVPLRSVLVTPSRAATLAPLLAALGDGVEVLVAERTTLAATCGFDVHRGVLAAADRPAARDPEALLASARRVVVAERLNDQENLGALFRNAAGLGVDGVLLDQRSADPLSRRAVRVSLGWSLVLPHARLGPLPDGLEVLHRAGMRTVALTPAPDAVPVDVAADRGLLDDPVGLVVGAEGPGLSPETLTACTHRTRVPMHGSADSLNVATALAVVASFAAARRGWR